MVGVTVAQVAERLDAVRARIAGAGGHDVRVVAVTKTFGLDAVLAAAAAGCDGIGENYAQELVAKLSGRPSELALPPVHFIGQLQTNKVRSVVPYVDVYESVDRASLVDELGRRAPGATVLLQVRPPGDGAGKAGCDLDEVPALLERCRERGLVVRGLMTVGPTTGGPVAARPGFRAVRAMVDRWGLDVCSMGMTDDLEVAVGEGSTQVRVGSALFGPRPPR
jgi:pyridoxal phosphate enzyme (YggS family)